MENQILFSIIIPTRNEEKNLPVLLKSLFTQSEKKFEIIINDSGSTDNTRSVAKNYENAFSGIKFIEHPTKNVSQARNNGARFAKSKWLIFFDADVEVEPDFITTIESYIQKRNLDILTVWNRPKTRSLTGIILLCGLNIVMTLSQKIKPIANGPCIIMKRSLFETLKGFDDTILFGEDFDLLQRAHKAKASFAVYRKPILYVSTRRFEKEGLIKSLHKSIKAYFHQLIHGPIRKPIFEYEMGGQYYKKNPKP